MPIPPVRPVVKVSGFHSRDSYEATNSVLLINIIVLGLNSFCCLQMGCQDCHCCMTIFNRGIIN